MNETHEGTVQNTRHGVFVDAPRWWAGRRVRVTLIKDKPNPAPACSAGDDSSPEFEPCDVCGGTEANFDGFCPQCELPMDVKPNTALTGGGTPSPLMAGSTGGAS